jgi:hypothetical protein
MYRFYRLRPSIPSAGKSKKQLQNNTIGTIKPKTQWFCADLAKTLTLSNTWTAQNKVPLFF